MPPRAKKKVMTQPIALIFRMLQSGATVRVWLHGTAERRMEGRIIVRGFAGLGGLWRAQGRPCPVPGPGNGRRAPRTAMASVLRGPGPGGARRGRFSRAAPPVEVGPEQKRGPLEEAPETKPKRKTAADAAQGFDEFCNIVLDDAVEVWTKKGQATRNTMGRMLLKGDTVTLIQQLA